MSWYYSAIGAFPDRSSKSCRSPMCTPAGNLIARERTATQIARVRFDPGTVPPALNSTVYVHMHYTDLASRAADGLIGLFGFR